MSTERTILSETVPVEVYDVAESVARALTRLTTERDESRAEVTRLTTERDEAVARADHLAGVLGNGGELPEVEVETDGDGDVYVTCGGAADHLDEGTTSQEYREWSAVFARLAAEGDRRAAQATPAPTVDEDAVTRGVADLWGRSISREVSVLSRSLVERGWTPPAAARAVRPIEEA